MTKKKNTGIVTRVGVWVKIPGWDDYEIDEYGNVFSLRRGRMMKTWTDGKKYPRLTLSNKTKEKSFMIHRLVALSFIPNPYGKISVNHIDGNKQNNHVSNLEWVTHSENMKHAYIHGLAIPPILPSGEKHPSSKLNHIDILMIRVLAENGFNNEQIAKRFKVSNAHISKILLNKTRKAG